MKGLALVDTGNYPAMLDRVYQRLLTPQKWRAYAATRNQQPPFVENAFDEQVDLEASYAQMAKAQRRHPLPKMPLVVISHGIPDPPMGKELVPGVNAAIETAWQKLQIKLATLVPGGRRVVATKSGHGIPAEQPGLVVDVIKDMLQQIGTRSPRPEAKVRRRPPRPSRQDLPVKEVSRSGSMKIAGWRRLRFRESPWR